MKKLLSLAFAIIISVGAFAQNYPFNDTKLPVDQRVEDLMGRLTLDEKIGMMRYVSLGVERLGVKDYNWWNEALHGVARNGLATVFPQSTAMAATFDDELHYEVFSVISDEARAKYNYEQSQGRHAIYCGLTFWTPNINIYRDPRWGRGMETYGEDPYLTSRMGLAAVRGLQGNDPKYMKAHACAKHFAVHSGPEWSRHVANVSPEGRDLYETYVPAFKALVQEGNVQEVMCAYQRFEGDPCCASNTLLQTLLRDKFGYKNLVVTDCWAVSDFYEKGFHETHPDAASASAAAVKAGVQLECGASFHALKEAVEKGLLTEKDIDDCVRMLITKRMELGMFDPLGSTPWDSYDMTMVDSPEHKALALKQAEKSIVLLKNDALLPLSKKIGKIAVLGPNADNEEMLWANYNGFPSSTVTILEGIRDKFSDREVVYERGCNHCDSLDLEAVSRVADADLFIFVGGLSPSLEGEEMGVNYEGFKGGDRTLIELPEVQRNMLAALRAAGKPVILVLCNGGAIALASDVDNCDAIVEAWYGGQAAGTALANVLSGDCNPGGRLPVTFYASSAQLPDFESYSMDGRTYRYMTEKPLYEFGYGLSYSEFRYKKASLSKKKINAGEKVDVKIRLRNVSKNDGDEVVQVYVKRLNDSRAPVKSLKQFRRVSIKAGDKCEFALTLEPDAFAYYDEVADDLVIKPGKYLIMYGSSSERLKRAKLTVK